MNILVLGGTGFFGKHLVWELLHRGHEVTIATRGRTPDDFGRLVKPFTFTDMEISGATTNRIVLDCRSEEHTSELQSH